MNLIVGNSIEINPLDNPANEMPKKYCTHYLYWSSSTSSPGVITANLLWKSLHVMRKYTTESEKTLCPETLINLNNTTAKLSN
ncbi:1425_t:CDS:2 [Ambispora gerdemannii]|uniref:1425_t:CDS:1 n=1 Tax=Ambispora gerdemannii TaxID=144530 RepID=A0A9N9BTX9_9GLOM|nr:1425_t:CDS:2 [Ambispora gerdemannii]